MSMLPIIVSYNLIRSGRSRHHSYYYDDYYLDEDEDIAKTNASALERVHDWLYNSAEAMAAAITCSSLSFIVLYLCYGC